jgi:hypothetical protein
MEEHEGRGVGASFPLLTALRSMRMQSGHSSGHLRPDVAYHPTSPISVTPLLHLVSNCDTHITQLFPRQHQANHELRVYWVSMCLMLYSDSSMVKARTCIATNHPSPLSPCSCRYPCSSPLL